MKNTTISKSIAPVVGIGATFIVGSDSYPYTIKEVLSPNRIIAKEDTAELVDGSCCSEYQVYKYSSNAEGREVVLSLRNNGMWTPLGEKKRRGYGFYIGVRRKYTDPSF